MTFQISPLDPASFAHLFDLSDAELALHNARRQRVTAKPDVPCRVSLADAEIGEDVLLVNHQHQPADSPYQSSHAVYIRPNVQPAALDIGEVPEVIASRLISLRMFDATGMIVDADVVDGVDLGPALERGFENAKAAYAHIHFAKPGCFAAVANRA